MMILLLLTNSNQEQRAKHCFDLRQKEEMTMPPKLLKSLGDRKSMSRAKCYF
jgi:hypothetical protein